MSSPNNFSESIDRLKESFLFAAAQGGNTQDCESLLAIGADINWENIDGDTALIAATRRGHTSTMKLLLSHGAYADKYTPDLKTPFHLACSRGDVQAVQVLLEAGADMSLQTEDGYTGYQLAERNNHAAAMDALKRQKDRASNQYDSISASNLSPILGSSPSRDRHGGASSAPMSPPRGHGHGTGSTANDTRSVGSAGLAENVAMAINDALAHSEAGTSGFEVNSESGIAQAAAATTAINASVTRKLKLREERLKSGADGGKSASLQSFPRSGTGSSAGSGSGNRGPDVTGEYSLLSTRLGPSGGSGKTKSGVQETGKTSAPAVDTNGEAFANHLDENCPYVRLLENETRDKKAFESRIMYMNEEFIFYKKELAKSSELNQELTDKLSGLSQQYVEIVDDYKQQINDLKLKLHNATIIATTNANAAADKSANSRSQLDVDITSLATVIDCEKLEKELQNKLIQVEKRRDFVSKQTADAQLADRLCVICCEGQKSVVLLPCRHMCLCDVCGHMDRIDTCPLCRVKITNKLSVFS